MKKPVMIHIDQDKIDKLKWLAKKEAVNREGNFLYTDLIRELIDKHIKSKGADKAKGHFVEAVAASLADKEALRATAAQRSVGSEPGAGEETQRAVSQYFGGDAE
jgi:hypothetical protein